MASASSTLRALLAAATPEEPVCRSSYDEQDGEWDCDTHGTSAAKCRVRVAQVERLAAAGLTAKAALWNGREPLAQLLATLDHYRATGHDLAAVWTALDALSAELGTVHD